jgi:hypothetical protein
MRMIIGGSFTPLKLLRTLWGAAAVRWPPRDDNSRGKVQNVRADSSAGLDAGGRSRNVDRAGALMNRLGRPDAHTVDRIFVRTECYEVL